ncbi:MAG: PKD domain-containing protein, partial [Deltaproteobacteria bacterium]
LVALGAAACGGGPSETPKAPPATTAPAAPAPPAAAAAGPTTTVAAGEEAAPLLAWADAEPEDGKAPLEVQFKADTEGGKPPLKFKWTFGDGTSDSEEANPKHTFDKAGKYRADLTVNDAAGDSDTDYVEIEVE